MSFLLDFVIYEDGVARRHQFSAIHPQAVLDGDVAGVAVAGKIEGNAVTSFGGANKSFSLAFDAVKMTFIAGDFVNNRLGCGIRRIKILECSFFNRLDRPTGRQDHQYK